MWIRQIFFAVLCVCCAVQKIDAVVNKASFEETASNNVENANNKEEKSETTDAVAEESKIEANRRDASVLSDSYGVPIQPGSLDSYRPASNLPLPVYGVPDHPSNNIAYPAPPPDIPPPLPGAFASSNNLDLPPAVYGTPNTGLRLPFDKYGPPFKNFRHPPSLPVKYGPPKLPKVFISKPFKPRVPHIPSKPLFIPKSPKPIYGPPKYHRKPKPSYGPPKFTYGPPGVYLGSGYFNNGPPKHLHGPPKYVISSPHNHYGPPDPVPHPPPPGVPAPPTPPEIKYDGWKPIPGLVSHPPSNNYEIPLPESHGNNDLLLNSDFTPPPIGQNQESHIIIESHSNVNNYGSSQISGVSDSYGAPLNAVTGSGKIVTSSVGSGDHSGDIKLGLSAVGVNAGQNDNLSVIKSIGYEILQQSNGQYYVNNNGGVQSSQITAFPTIESDAYIGTSGAVGEFHNEGFGGAISNSYTSGIHGGDSDLIFSGVFPNTYLPPVSGDIHLDSYSAPPSDSYSITGPYAAAHSYKTNGLSSGKFNTFNQFKKYPSYKPEGGLSNAATKGGLIPPSGQYGIPPSGQYGTPLIGFQSSQLNALDINPPRHPVVFREPVPHGVLQSLKGRGHHQKDAKGLVHNIHLAQYAQNHHDISSTYIPPPIPDVSKPVKEDFTHITSEQHLPSIHTHTTFRGDSFNHGDSYSTAFNQQGAQVGHLTSYQAPFNSLNNLYGAPSTSVGIHQDHHLQGSSIGLDASHSLESVDFIRNQAINPYGYAGVPHDCNAYKSQPLPSISYGVPSANAYTASLSSLTTNIGGGFQSSAVPVVYGVPDLQPSHSHVVSIDKSVNSIDANEKESIAKSLVPGAEVIPSQSIDFHSIPVQVPNTYAFHIQSSENTRSNENAISASNGQYLNDALLQSVLNAVEQTRGNEVQVNTGGAISANSGYGLQQTQDLDSQYSIRNEVFANSNSLNTTSNLPSEVAVQNKPLSLIDNNEIALYFNKNLGKNTKTSEDAMANEEEVINGQPNAQLQNADQNTEPKTNPTDTK
ncbi:hypothetical protein WA026_008905 [Henosepilachna vigintioctopunctata]|uniref:Uncharacterized protein n=1 Tax=Henosepilachna vigintioctopunctata TaxID=420089 RepID=A0AAW1V338_9CUCU